MKKVFTKKDQKDKVKKKSISKKEKKQFQDKEYDNLISFQRNLNIDKELFISEVNGRKDLKQLEHYLHFIMIRLNNFNDISDIFNFNTLLEYHKIKRSLKQINNKENTEDFTQKKTELEKSYPFIGEFYNICLEFLSFLTDLSFEYRILENSNFSYKKNKLVNEFTSEITENYFHFHTFFYISNYFENEAFHPSEDLKEKNHILQYKFFVILNKFWETYPLPKDPNELQEFYTNLVTKSKEQGEKKNMMKESQEGDNKLDKKVDKSARSEEVNFSKTNRNLSEKREKKKDEDKLEFKQENKTEIKEEVNLVPVQTTSKFTRIFCCWCKPKKDISEENKLNLVKLFTPLLTLNISENPSIHIQILKRMLTDFTKAYLIVEEALFKEMNDQIVKKVEEIEEKEVKEEKEGSETKKETLKI